MQIILETNGLWEMIEPNEKTQADNKKDKTAMAFLYQALPEEQLLQITKHKTAKAIWDALKSRHIGEETVQQARLETLKSDFEMLHMKEDETIDTFTDTLTTLVNKAASLGYTIEDQTLVRKLLNAIPERYLQIVASIEQYSDLKEMNLKEAVGRLKTYEERIKYKKGKQVDSQDKLMFTRHENKGKYFRGRGRGKHKFSPGRNHEHFKEERKEGEISHKKVEEKEVSLNEEDVGYKETYIDGLWYLDNRASNHMNGVREHFKELDEVNLKEEVYITQPKGFIKKQDQGKVYRLIEALYGLGQAPRSWNIKLDNTLKSLDFKKCTLEKAIYTKRSKDSTQLIGIYVDDLIITGTPKKEIDKFKAQMEEKFKMSYLGLLAYYLGIEVTQTNGDISIKQSAYASKILKEAEMIDCNETLIPMDPGTRLTKSIEETMVNSMKYQSLIGCLRYLLHTRLDLSYSVGLLSRFIECVKREDIQVDFVSGEYQKADILTKALPKIKFLTMRQLIAPSLPVPKKKPPVPVKPPHPDTKYLSQILSVPKPDQLCGDDDLEWLFNRKEGKKPPTEDPQVQGIELFRHSVQLS
nr:ribonuclease H-like domain, reverse transcriptase, RNA-dependent DNA polymerase [Tanacetum cinerariifolium]